MYKIDSHLVSRDRLLPGIHGLRGVAALAVVLYHLVHIGAVQPPVWLGFISRDFGYSVHLFFILSAFSLMHSTRPALERPNWLAAYFTKRFFRIAPLFYALIVFELGRQFAGGGMASSATTVLLNVGLIFGVVPFSGIVWGGWSVGIEIIFYVIFPVLLMGVRTHRIALWFLLVSIVISHLTRSELHLRHLAMVPPTTWDWSYFAFSPNLAFFSMGIYAFFVARHVNQNRRLILMIIVPATAVLLIGLTFFDLGKLAHTNGRLDILLWGGDFPYSVSGKACHRVIWWRTTFLSFWGNEASASILFIRSSSISPDHIWQTCLSHSSLCSARMPSLFPL